MNKIFASVAGAALALSATAALAHHGTSVSYDMDHPWTTDATVVEFTYSNPHPRMIFVRTNDKGQSEQWESELISNPSMMMRAGWNRTRTAEALKAGSKVKLTLSTSKANPRAAVVRSIQNQAGQYIVMGNGPGQGVAPAGAAPAR